MFRSPDRARQLILFDGIKYGNIAPTDFDAVIEYKDRVWLVFEVKLADKELPRGQRLALERLIGDAKKAGKHGMAIVCEHRVLDPLQDVILADCMVREVYTTEMLRWFQLRKPFRAVVVAGSYLRHYEGDSVWVK